MSKAAHYKLGNEFYNITRSSNREQKSTLMHKPQRAPPAVYLQVNCTNMIQIPVLFICRNSITLFGYKKAPDLYT